MKLRPSTALQNPGSHANEYGSRPNPQHSCFVVHSARLLGSGFHDQCKPFAREAVPHTQPTSSVGAAGARSVAAQLRSSVAEFPPRVRHFIVQEILHPLFLLGGSGAFQRGGRKLFRYWCSFSVQAFPRRAASSWILRSLRRVVAEHRSNHCGRISVASATIFECWDWCWGCWRC